MKQVQREPIFIVLLTERYIINDIRAMIPENRRSYTVELVELPPAVSKALRSVSPLVWS